MKRIASIAALTSLLFVGTVLPSDAATRGGSHTPKSGAYKPPKPRASSSTAKTSHRSTEARARDKNGRIAKSEGAKDSFMRQTGYAKGRKGYVVDHIIPLACGGSDSPSNMQWQTVADARAKDQVERKGCH